MTKKYSKNKEKISIRLKEVWKRVRMYIGLTNKTGLYYLIWEIVDNSINEVMAGFASEIKIMIIRSGSIDIEDYGCVLSTEIDPKTNLAEVTTILTEWW